MKKIGVRRRARRAARGTRARRRASRPGRSASSTASRPAARSDIIGRLLAEQFTKQLGKTVVVDNKAGASGMIAAAETAKSAPDGHTILLASMAMMTVLPQMVKTSIDVDKDLTTIGNVAERLQHPRGRPRHVLQELAGRREGGQGQPGEGDLRHRRLGLEPAALLRAVHGADRHQAHAGALSRRRAGDHRHDRRPGRPDVGQHAGVHGPDPRRRPARDRLRRRCRPHRCCPRCR